ncbi:MAG: hypothetical protein RIR79_2069 [Pseudomonadota bacterium]|jgi:4-hydroxy-tetrahydrodipicolinate reductase
MKVGLFGFGKAGRAVANVLQEDSRFSLQWVARRTAGVSYVQIADAVSTPSIPVVGLNSNNIGTWLDKFPVDAIIDFSGKDSLAIYGEEVKHRQIMVVSAISAYEESHLQYAHEVGNHTRIVCSPNITLGINFLILAARLLRNIAPFADVEILEQHFKSKTEVSGTARKIADTLELGTEKITSLRLGGIVGHHEVIFGFPYQTVRLVHESIKREAFGTGAVFALTELINYDIGFYTFEDLLMNKIRSQLLNT